MGDTINVKISASDLIKVKVVQGTSAFAPVLWGEITGTLADQTDLNTALGLKAVKTTTISAGSGITGGGDLSENRTLSVDINGLDAISGPDGDADYLMVYDASAGTLKKMLTKDMDFGLTAGSIPFIGASGALSQDNSNLFWDDTNNRLGIGTNTPATALDVSGTITGTTLTDGTFSVTGGDITANSLTFSGSITDVLIYKTTSDIKIQMSDLGGDYSVQLYYGGSAKFGIGENLAGGAVADGVLINGIDLFLSTEDSQDGVIYGGTGNASNLVLSSTSLTGGGSPTTLGKIYLGDAKTSYFDETTEALTLTGGLSCLGFTVSATGAVFNEAGADVDFRIESDTNENMFFVDAGNNAIGLCGSPVALSGALDWVTGNVIYVPFSTGTSMQTAINAAITAASSGDIIELAAGDWVVDGQITLNKKVYLRGQGIDRTTISTTAAVEIIMRFDGSTGAEVSDLTVSYKPSVDIAATRYIAYVAGDTATMRRIKIDATPNDSGTNSFYTIRATAGANVLVEDLIYTSNGNCGFQPLFYSNAATTTTVTFRRCYGYESNSTVANCLIITGAAGLTLNLEDCHLFSTSSTAHGCVRNSGGIINIHGGTYSGAGALAYDLDRQSGTLNVYGGVNLVNNKTTGTISYVGTLIAGTLGIGGANTTGNIATFTQNGDTIGFLHDGTDAYMKWLDGKMFLMSNEGTNADSIVEIKGKGTGAAGLFLRDGGNAQYLTTFCQLDSISYLDFGTATTAFVINEAGADVDFRVEGNGNANCLVVDAGNDNVSINAATLSANYDLALLGDGVLCIKETATPTADADHGKVYCKSDNKLYFQDGAGVEHEIAFV